MKGMVVQSEYKDEMGIQYTLLVGNNAMAALTMTDTDSGGVVAVYTGVESIIRAKYRALVHKVAALELLAAAQSNQ